MSRHLFIVFISFFIAMLSFGQKDQIPITIQVEKLTFNNFGGGDKELIFKFYKDSVSISSNLMSQCIIISTDKKQGEADSVTYSTINNNGYFLPFWMETESDSLHIIMENFENDKGEPCTYDKGDDDYHNTGLHLQVPSLPVGIFTGPFTIENEQFTAVLRIKVGIPAPKISTEGIHQPVEVSSLVQLSAKMPAHIKNDLTYYWQCNLNQSDNWIDLPPASVTTTLLKIDSLITGNVISRNTMAVRVYAATPESKSNVSQAFDIQILPASPKCNKDEIIVKPTCPGKATGEITIKNLISSTDSIWYYGIKSNELKEEFFPDNIVESAIAFKGSIGKNDVLRINNLAEGLYQLVIKNSTPPVGKAFNHYALNVSLYPELKISATNIIHAHCDTTNEGAISLQTIGGNPAPLTFFMDPPVGKRTVDSTGRAVLFSQLPTGIYRIVVQDECLSSSSLKDITIVRDMKNVIAKVSLEEEPVNDGDNGVLKVEVKNHIGVLYYKLIKNEAPFKSDNKLPATFTIDKITKGSYILKITDSLQNCSSGWDTSFSIKSKLRTAPDKSDFFTGGKKPETKAKAEVIANKEDEPKRPPASASFTKVDNLLEFYNTNIRTSKTIIGFKEDESESQEYTIVVSKSKYEMAVLNAKNDTIIIYPVVFGNNDQGDKMMEGDRKTPEGNFVIKEKREHEKWHKIMLLNYPNDNDIKEFYERQRKGELPPDAKIGGAIAIHGSRDNEDIEVDKKKNWTDGCVATKNVYMDQLYKYIAVGTRVIIVK